MALPTDMATDTATTDTPMPLDTTMARGLLMLSPLLRLMPTTATLLWLLPPLCPLSTEVLFTGLPLSMAVSTAATPLPTMDTMDTSATTDTPTCITATDTD